MAEDIFASYQLIKDGTEGPHITLITVGLASHYFWSHGEGRSALPVCCFMVVHGLCKAKISNFDDEVFFRKVNFIPKDWNGIIVKGKVQEDVF